MAWQKPPAAARFAAKMAQIFAAGGGGVGYNLDMSPPVAARRLSLPAAALPKAKIAGLNVVHCADVAAALPALAGENLFDVAVADPPYNIGKDFGNNQDNLALDDYLQWCDSWLGECLRLVKPAAPVYVYGFSEILARLAARLPLNRQRWLVWHYTNKTVPTLNFWQRSHESILCLWKGERPRLRVDAVREPYTPAFLNGAAGKTRAATHCRYSQHGRETVYNAHAGGALPRDVLKTPALAGGAGRAERYFYCHDCARLCKPAEAQAHRAHNVTRHPTQKPAELTRRLLASATTAGGRALLPFAGSGAECVVAKSMGIDFYAAEINPDYTTLANAWLAATPAPKARQRPAAREPKIKILRRRGK